MICTRCGENTSWKKGSPRALRELCVSCFKSRDADTRTYAVDMERPTAIRRRSAIGMVNKQYSGRREDGWPD